MIAEIIAGKGDPSSEKLPSGRKRGGQIKKRLKEGQACKPENYLKKRGGKMPRKEKMRSENKQKGEWVPLVRKECRGK